MARSKGRGGAKSGYGGGGATDTGKIHTSHECDTAGALARGTKRWLIASAGVSVGRMRK